MTLPTHVLLDRDGVLNDESRRKYVLRRADWRWLPGAREAIRALVRGGVPVGIATNQSAVGRGLLAREELDRIHGEVLGDLGLDLVMVCPHAPAAVSGGETCDCRKPAPGLILSAASFWNVRPARVLLVGDAMSDLLAASAAGAQFAMVATGKHAGSAPALLPDAPAALWGGSPFVDLAACVQAYLASRENAPGAFA